MSASRRVLHLLESGGLYGAEHVVLNLSEQMKLAGEFEPVIGCIVQRRGEEVALYDEARRRGLAAERITLNNLLLARDAPRAASWLRAQGIDLVHSHGYKATVFGDLVRRLARVPITATCHLWYIEPGAPLKMKVMVSLEMRIYRRFRTVAAVSEEIRGVLVRAGVAADRVPVIPNGIPLEQVPLPAAKRKALRAELGAADGDFLVLSAGRLSAQKDQATLLRAIGRLEPSGRPVRCVVAGDGELHAPLEALIAENRWQAKIRLLGFRDDIPALLQAADVFVLSSIDEGMPMILLETAAAGTPIVATPVGDVPKLLRDGETGLVVPKGDDGALAGALRRLRDDPALAAALGQAAREQVSREFSSAAMYDHYCEVYRQNVRD